MGKHTANNLKKKPNKLWWTYPRHAKWKTIAQSLEIPKKMLHLQEKSLNELIMLPKFSPINDQNRNINLSPDMEIVKITTIVEAIRQKRERSAQISEATKNIQKIIGKKRLKRSSHESRYNSMITTDSWHDREKKTFTSNKRAPYPKSHYRDQQKKSLPTRKRAVDLKANNIAIPSTVFYKRIWEYINGTRPHSDIISDYSFLKNNSEKNNSTCTDKDRITASQSQKHYLQMTSSNIKPEQDFYKRIWDIINATQSTYENTKTRSKRNANIPKSDTSTQLCVQGRKANYAESKQLQAINDKVAFDTAETINLREISDPYISRFWNFTNNTQWQPKTTIPIVNTIKLNNDLISSPNVNIASASEVADLNKFPDNVETNIDYLSSDNSTKYEKHNKSQKINEPRPPYSSQEQKNSTILSSSSIEHTIDNTSKKEDQTKYTKDYLINTTPIYDPLNIPYVEVPDYTDQQEDTLDKDNQNSTAANYKVYDDSDYIDFERHNPDEFSSKSPSDEIKILQNIQTGNNEPEVSLNVNISHSRCTENKDSMECTDKYDVEDTELLNNTETSGDVQRSIEDSVESMLSNERKNSTTDFVDFDINEYRKPFNLDDFIKNDPIFESIRTTNSKENTKHNSKENPVDRSEESEEYEIYATVPKEKSNYFKKNENYDDGITYDDRDEAKKNIHSSAEEKAEDSDVISEDHYHYDDKDFLKHIFEKNNDKESSESVDTEDEFLSRYFTKDILDQLRDNSTAEEERQREESRNREEIHKTLTRILDKKDRFSRLDENLDKMIKEGETIPIRYKNFWSLEYESPHKKNKAIEETET